MRKLLAIILILATSPVMAIGAGTPQVNSALGQPLNLVIPLSGVADYTDQQLQIALADPEIYETLGVDFKHLHQQLRFRQRPDDNNNMLLEVTTHRPVNEPYLHFVLHIKTPDSQLIKNIQVLLDTPEL